ncbi:cupin domain-containing protein [Gordonia sp. TBRC 11910]|uniref:Cupin domain-containing protein n=1 Tax=Gordonia asplenii TaxID=2725283 RepID=A0A848KT99_9ACTN|nr:cupin domain-containing protein [Gordonia asplenii]NMO01700.1 cupin domain-containing protein [Gordonia asplenii]
MINLHRVVTGHDDAGRSRILFDDAGTNDVTIDSWPGGLKITELWVTDEAPANAGFREDRATRPLQHDPVAGGTIFRWLEFPPETEGESFDAAAIFDALGSDNRPSSEMSTRHFSMHRTDSVDYLVILSGTMTMVMDDGEAQLGPGTCIVQQGTNHAWVNKGTEPCVMAAILVDAEAS